RDARHDDVAVAVEARAGERRQLGEAKAAVRRGWRHRGVRVTAGPAAPRRAARYLSASALITFSVMSMRWLAYTTGSCRMRSYFSASAICWMTLFARARIPAP